jgi:hypothetical protein
VDDLYSLVVGAGGQGVIRRRYNLLYVGVARLARSFELDDVLNALEVDIQYTVANGARRKVFFHAGVVGWHGRALVMLGASAPDTTRLVAALTRAGATYYAHRYAVLDAHGRVHPFPTALQSAGAHDDSAGAHSMEMPGNRVGHETLPVGAIVLFAHTFGAHWRPRALTRGQAVLALLAHAVSAAQRPAFALRVADAAVARAHAVLSGALGDASEVVTALLDATEERTHSHLGGRHAESYSKRKCDESQDRR